MYSAARISKTKLITLSARFLLEADHEKLAARELMFFKRFEIGYFRASNLTGLLTFEIQPNAKAQATSQARDFISEHRPTIIALTEQVCYETERKRERLEQRLEKRGLLLPNSRTEDHTSFCKYQHALSEQTAHFLSTAQGLNGEREMLTNLQNARFVPSQIAKLLAIPHHSSGDTLGNFISAVEQPATMVMHKFAVRITADKEKFERQLGIDTSIPFKG